MALPTIISNAGNKAVQVSATTATIYGFKLALAERGIKERQN